jgi:hypothetical protein
MRSANPLWGAPRIHGELVKVGIEVSQATVAKYMGRRIGTPSPTWRTSRPVQPPTRGKVIAIPQVGGLTIVTNASRPDSVIYFSTI